MSEFTTRVVAIDPTTPDRTAIAEAASIIRSGQLVAFPTETVYGLGADGLNPIALGRIYSGERPTTRQSPHPPSRQPRPAFPRGGGRPRALRSA